MADILMCVAEDCPFSKQCKRHTDSGTKAGYMQAWSIFIKHGDEVKQENCEWFIKKVMK